MKTTLFKLSTNLLRGKLHHCFYFINTAQQRFLSIKDIVRHRVDIVINNEQLPHLIILISLLILFYPRQTISYYLEFAIYSEKLKNYSQLYLPIKF